MIENNKYEILTPTGFSDFDGIHKTVKQSIKFIFDDDTDIVTSRSHRFVNKGKEITASSLQVGDVVNSKIIVDIIDNGIEELYDPINVQLGNVYFGNDLVHHNCEFLGSSATLISAQCIAQMKPKKPIYEKDNLVLFEQPVRGTLNSDMTWNKKPGVYAITVDTSMGVGGDANAFSIIRIDSLPYKTVGRFKDNIISPLLYPNVIYKWAKEYNDAWVLVELNKSEQVPYILQQELEYENIVYVTKDAKKGQRMTGGFGGGKSRYGVLTDKKTKRIGCSMFKTLTEENKLEIYDVDTISEISTFIESRGSYAADDGYSDDIVMTLVLFGWMASQPYFKELTDIDLRESIYNNRVAEIESEMLPLGMFNDGNTQPGEEVWTDWNGGY